MTKLSLLFLSLLSLNTFSYENVVCESTNGVTSVDMDLSGEIKQVTQMEDGADYNLAYGNSPNHGQITILDREGQINKVAPKKGFAFIYDGVLNVGSGFDVQTGSFDQALQLYFNLQTRKGLFFIDGEKHQIKSCYSI